MMNTYYDYLYEMSRIDKSIQTENRLVVSWGMGGAANGMSFFGGDENGLEVGSAEGCTR